MFAMSLESYDQIMMNGNHLKMEDSVYLTPSFQNINILFYYIYKYP